MARDEFVGRVNRRGPMSEDPRFVTLSMPDDYPDTTDSPIRYVPVIRGATVVGYLWAAVTDDAVSFEERPDTGDLGGNTAINWTDRTRWAKAYDVSPLRMLRDWAGLPEDPETGYVLPGAEREAPSLDALRAIAAAPAELAIVAAAKMPRGPVLAQPRHKMTYSSSGYPDSTDGAVRFVPVSYDGRLVGYLWAAVADDAAGFLVRADAGPAGREVAPRWAGRSQWARANGVSPLRMLRHWVGRPADRVTGDVSPNAERELPSLAALREMADRG